MAMKIYDDLTQLIGNTPLLNAKKLTKALKLSAKLLLKIEAFNPGGSVKDRLALAMIEAAERIGTLQPGGTIIEPTSGNTGIGLAWVASIKGYRLILTMPDSMSEERRKLLHALGAEIELTPGAEGMSGAIQRAQYLKEHTPGAIILQQFNNEVGPQMHEQTTGQEILRDTDGQVDVFIAGVGTGGTITGVGRALKKHNPQIQVVAVEPLSSPVLSGGVAAPHQIQGIGAGFIPKIYDASVVDHIIPIADDDAYRGMQLLTKHEGLFCGISAGAALMAAIKTAQRPEYEGATIVVLLPDTGDRYLSLLV
jgi:cysteine synthase A